MPTDKSDAETQRCENCKEVFEKLVGGLCRECGIKEIRKQRGVKNP